MLGTGAHLAANTIERTCRELGATNLPTGYLDALADADELQKNLAGFSNSATAADLIDSVFDALADGRHPADCEQVRRLLVMTQLQNYELHRQADTRAKAMRGDAVTRYADDFIRLWADATADDGTALWETAQSPVFAGVTNLDSMSPSQLPEVGDYQRWATATASARRLDAAAAGFHALLSATRLNYPTGYATLILAPGIGPDELAELNRATDRARPDAFTIARHGIAPTLCDSLAGFAAACGQLGSELTARAQAATAAPTRF